MRTLLDGLLEALHLILSLDPIVLEIAGRSLQVTSGALIISSLIGVPAGVLLALNKVPARRLITVAVYTGMGMPPVVAGLIVYLFLSNSGVLGNLEWLFTIRAMIIAQVIIATPVVTGVTMSSVLSVNPQLGLQLRALGATRRQIQLAILREAQSGVLVGIIAAFGSIISEVGAVMLVGGNIDGRTRVLTTAIVLETRQGNFDLALALGIILLSTAFIANFFIALGQGRIRGQL